MDDAETKLLLRIIEKEMERISAAMTPLMVKYQGLEHIHGDLSRQIAKD